MFKMVEEPISDQGHPLDTLQSLVPGDDSAVPTQGLGCIPSPLNQKLKQAPIPVRRICMFTSGNCRKNGENAKMVCKLGWGCPFLATAVYWHVGNKICRENLGQVGLGSKKVEGCYDVCL